MCPERRLPNGDAWPVLSELPSGPGWEFAGYPYGLEPLTLPEPGAPDQPSDCAPSTYAGTCRLIRQIVEQGARVEPCASAETLFGFRWIVGHQVSFIVWRLMAQLLDEVADGRLAWTDVLGPLCRYVRGYGAMLLYTGSCPRATYHAVIRPSMRLRHPSFSGSWAADYWPVRDLVRSRRLPFAQSPESTDLLHAIRLLQLVHDGVAAKLVPDGRSLLRQSTVRRQDTQVLHLIYDNYFLTLRAPVSRHDVVVQLLRRAMAIAHDIAVNDLHPPAVTDAAERPDELSHSEVVACERGIAGIVADVATCAAGLPEERSGDGLLAEDGPSVSFAGC
jgi:hypothetical protein